MTVSDDTFGRDLERWLRDEGERRVPDHLGEVLVRTAATRQRPWWSSPERWLPMDSVASPRATNLRPILVFLIASILVVGAVGVAYVASRPRIPFGPASNGRIYVPTGQTIVSYAADGSDPEPLVDAPETNLVSMSPDGTRIAFWQGPDNGSVRIVPVEGGTPVTVSMPDGIFAGDPIAWSPDSSRIAFPAFRAGFSEEFLYVANADGTGATRLGGEAIPSTTAIWWPKFSPDGEWISYIGVPNGAGKDPAPGDLYLIHTDGTGLVMIATGVDVEGAGFEPWSPDPARPRLVYTMGNGTRVYDVVSGKTTVLGVGFWPSWSPDGRRIASWSNGLVVVDPDDAPFTSDEYLRVGPVLNGTCQANTELAGKAICSAVTWSPDGTRVLGTDVGGGGIVSLPVDGQGEPILLPAPGAESGAWQPVR